MTPLFAQTDTAAGLWQFVLLGLVNGSLYALIALGYSMVYGIVELINFAHGDLFMLGAFLALTILLAVAPAAGTAAALAVLAVMLAAAPVFCAALNVAVDRVIYRPLRTAPKLAPLVSAIGVSFVFMNVGQFWYGPLPQNFPQILPAGELFPGFGYRELLVVGVTVPSMVGLTLFVRYATLGKAMRAVAQNPTAARLMGVDVDRVIAATFAIGGGLAGLASVVYGLYNGTVGYQMGFTNGLYAFTAAVVGGIGSLPGAVLGGLLIGLVRSLGSAYVDEKWSPALIFLILIVILIFRPAGLLGSRTREKV
jgi:branched-chain amino acid transport system permease protein